VHEPQGTDQPRLPTLLLIVIADVTEVLVGGTAKDERHKRIVGDAEPHLAADGVLRRALERETPDQVEDAVELFKCRCAEQVRIRLLSLAVAREPLPEPRSLGSRRRTSTSQPPVESHGDRRTA
jgi:hypothetical protein